MLAISAKKLGKKQLQPDITPCKRQLKSHPKLSNDPKLHVELFCYWGHVCVTYIDFFTMNSSFLTCACRGYPVNSLTAMVTCVRPLIFELRSKCRDSVNSCPFLVFDS